MVGAIVTCLLFEQFIARRERTEAQEARSVAGVGSSFTDVAVAAAEKLRQRGWLEDGSLYRANPIGGDLATVKLHGTDPRWADLRNAKLDKAVALPDGATWMPDTDMERFRHTGHPELRRSDAPHSPAYRGRGGR